jgi:DNA-binding NarL/FixJ family response regulator
MGMSKYRILVADDHPLYRTALRNVVSEAFDDVDVLECEDIGSALQYLESAAIDLVLLDLSMPDADGLDGLARLRAAGPATPIIICSAQDDPDLVRDCFKLGISGYLPKSSGTGVTRHALQLVRDGGVYVPSEALAEQVVSAGGSTEMDAAGSADVGPGGLTPRQRTVLSLLERGMSNKSIARELGIGEITVKAHVSAILRKLGVENRLQAIVAVRELKR